MCSMIKMTLSTFLTCFLLLSEIYDAESAECAISGLPVSVMCAVCYAAELVPARILVLQDVYHVINDALGICAVIRQSE